MVLAFKRPCALLLYITCPHWRGLVPYALIARPFGSAMRLDKVNCFLIQLADKRAKCSAHGEFPRTISAEARWTCILGREKSNMGLGGVNSRLKQKRFASRSCSFSREIFPTVATSGCNGGSTGLLSLYASPWGTTTEPANNNLRPGPLIRMANEEAEPTISSDIISAPRCYPLALIVVFVRYNQPARLRSMKKSLRHDFNGTPSE